MARKTRPTLAHWFQFLAYRCVEFFLGILSVDTTFSIGELIGRLIYRLPLAHRSIVLRNLRLAYRNEMSEEEIGTLAERVYELTGANLLSSIRIPSLSDQQIKDLVQFEHLNLLTEASVGRKGIVLLVPHMGNWELLAQAMGLIFPEIDPPIQGGTHYRPLNNPAMNRLIERRRKRRGTKLFSKGSSLHTLTAFLREGNLLAILADQRVGPRGETCNFFGLPTDCSPLPALLAKRTGATILALHCETTGPAQWKIVISTVRRPDTASCMQTLEAAWRSSPQDVFWFQDRWRYQISKGIISAPLD
ncbi:MAG: hypothetical protein OSB65_19775 [Roseibacillus sp.]|nr:hypothetical protein [Roseibacillus sp.]